MLHPPDDPNGGSTSAFWCVNRWMFGRIVRGGIQFTTYVHTTITNRLKSDPSYTPVGLNTLDGAYAVFGYVVDGQDILDELQQGDVIQSAKIIWGAEYLKQP